ncbi:hypothetical protein [Dokdonella sp.]|uniref:hypothetical protein n=1 Tax=Dokdonella sp. TaxID=2291710 RepID=UPI001B03EC86|nr:hypothetical protein [Dokdonella sp.]MBO9661867.1 hypothetical protein [Dokdonella sp.]
MNSSLASPLHATTLSTTDVFAPLRRAMSAAARFVLLMTQSGGGSQPGTQPGTPAPTDGDKKNDNGQSTDGTKPMDPPTMKKTAAPGRLRAALEA